ncbi:MAG: hypothetical protein SPL57_08810 [Lachnospiraceae bacterium]|nr:hypothetical protein [Lachnospiraceae bacterium]
MIRFLRGFRARKNADSIYKKTIITAIMSSAPELDTHTLSIALANYYRSARGMKTALAVSGGDRGFADMLRDSECVSIDPPGYDDGIMRYYLIRDLSDIERIAAAVPERLVLDLGCIRGDISTKELLICDRICALISTSPWRCLDTREFLAATIVKETGLRQRFRNRAYSVAGREEDDLAIGREFGISIRRIRGRELICDPYRLTRDDLERLNVFN